jgi:hypothetical protein
MILLRMVVEGKRWIAVMMRSHSSRRREGER